MRAVMLEIAADPVRARATFAAFQNRCAVCCQPIDDAHQKDAMHEACADRAGRERAESYRRHVQMARQLVAAGELDAGPSPAPPRPSRQLRAAYAR